MKTFVDEHLCVSEFFPYEKLYAYEGDITCFCRNYLSLSTGKVRGGTLLCFKKFPISIYFMHRRRKSRFSVGNILSNSTKNLADGPSVFQKNSGSVKIYARSGYNGFLLEIFFLTLAKKVVEEPFCIWESFWWRKNLWRWGEGITILRCKVVVPEYWKLSKMNISVFQKFSRIEKVYPYEGEISFFCRKYFVSL